MILPLFAILLAGAAAARLKLLPAAAATVLSRFVFAIALPAVIFSSLIRIEVADFFNWNYIGALGGGMLLTFVMGIAMARFSFRQDAATATVHGLTAMYSSTAYIGLPLILTLFGDSALVPGIIGAIITGLVFAPLAIVLLELGRDRRQEAHLLAPLCAVFTRPPILAAAAGLLVSAGGLQLPAPVIGFFEILGGAFVPCALFAAGLFVAGCSLRGSALELGWLAMAKLLLHPLITWWLAFHVFDLNPLFASVAVLQAALPSGVPVFVLAQQYGCYEARSSAAIAVTTALSVVTIPVLYLWLS